MAENKDSKDNLEVTSNTDSEDETSETNEEDLKEEKEEPKEDEEDLKEEEKDPKEGEEVLEAEELIEEKEDPKEEEEALKEEEKYLKEGEEVLEGEEPIEEEEPKEDEEALKEDPKEDEEALKEEPIEEKEEEPKEDEEALKEEPIEEAEEPKEDEEALKEEPKEDEEALKEEPKQDEEALKEEPIEEEPESDESKISLTSQDSDERLETQPPMRKRRKSVDEQRLKYIFMRPRYAEPRHPIFSSPFARHISAMAFGPKKPKWYQSLTTAQLYLFKDILNYVEVGRQSYFRFEDFLDALQDFDNTITRFEVLDAFSKIEANEFEELDFGKFLYLLAYRGQSSEDYPDSIEEKISSEPVTPRQCLILSAISFFVLIASPEEIHRYYFENTRRKSTVLHHHMEATRLWGLTDKQMEVKQRNATKHLGPLYFLTGSPYALPVPFVPRFTRGKIFKEWKRRKYPSSARTFGKRPIARPIIPFEIRRQLGEKATYETEDDELASRMNYGRIPLPQMRFPSEKLKQLRAGGYTVELKDYIMQKAQEALQRHRNRLKEAAVVYAKQNLKPILHEGFPTKHERDTFIEIYQRYLPLKLSEVKNYSLWVRPAGYRVSHSGKPLYPDQFAFGSKIS